MKYAVCTTIENYQILENLGFDFIELQGNQIAKMSENEFQNVKNTIKNGAVKCCGFNASLPPEVVFCGNNFDIENTKKYAELLCSRGYELGISTIGIGSPKSRQYTNGDIDFAWEQAYDFMIAFADIALKYDITIMYEALNDIESSFGNSSKEALYFVKKINRANVKIVFDVYHAFIQNETIDDIAESLPYIYHIHISECVSNKRPYMTQKSYDYIKNFLEPIIKNGYNRTISLECFVGDVKNGTETSLALLKQIISNSHDL